MKLASAALLGALVFGTFSAKFAEAAEPGNSERPDADIVDPTGPEIRLVYGSFASAVNAQRFAAQLAADLARTIDVLEPAAGISSSGFRVAGPVAPAEQIAIWREQAIELALSPWRLITNGRRGTAGETAGPLNSQASSEPKTRGSENAAKAPADGRTAPPRSSRSSNARVNFELGIQSRFFVQSGSNTSDQAQQSVSGQVTASAEFSGGANLLALDVFGRWDSDDPQRSHTDLRELSLTHVADYWQLQAGVGQVFWGVVEFNHLIDVVNQTDLVENLDTEDKLGQPMLTFTALPSWGSVELFVLPGFRRRTLPGISGRLTTPLPIDRGEAQFESGAGDDRVDGLLRVSTLLGGVLLDVYHFNGTRRTPRFEIRSRQSGATLERVLVPNYDTVKQTALAAQANAGDTAFKLEALQQDGGPESYWAAALGIEHTFVGVFGGSADLGAVVEYHYDSREGDAFDSFFESDLALGARLAANDINDSQALLGVVWDTRSQEWVAQLEASRRLSDRWSLALETRWFMGGEPLGRDAPLSDLLDTNNKLGAVQRDDYFQFEFTRFF